MPADPSNIRRPSLYERFYAQPYLLLILATLGFGGNAVAGRAAVDQISPMLLTTSRWGLVLAVMLLTCRKQIAEALPEARRRWPILLAMGTVGFTFFNALNYLAAHHTSAVNISIIQGMIPLLVLVGGMVAHKTPVRGGQIAGVCVAMAGVVAPSFICQVFFIRAVALIGPQRAGLFINMVPVFGALLAVLILGEAFGLHHALGLGLVLLGIVLSERAVRRDASLRVTPAG
jgi:drug/metabolite transporter (DMT)-like permease